jgi:hypothetical protein
VLYHLSYGPSELGTRSRRLQLTEPARDLTTSFSARDSQLLTPDDQGWLTGIEPATSGATVRRSNRLSYNHRERCQNPKQARQNTDRKIAGSRPKPCGKCVGLPAFGKLLAIQRCHRDHPSYGVNQKDREVLNLVQPRVTFLHLPHQFG